MHQESVCMALLSTALNETFVGSHAQQGKSDCSACQYVVVVCLWTQNEQFERIGIAHLSVSLLFYHKCCTLLRSILHYCCPFHTASSALSCVCRFHSPGHGWYGSLRLATQVHPPVLAHSVHVTVDLHCSNLVAVDPVVSRERACWE